MNQQKFHEKIEHKDLIEQELFQQAGNVLEVGKFWLNKSYLPMLSKYEIQPFDGKELTFSTDVRLFRIGRICLENKQSMLESLTAVYQALWSLNTTVFLFLDSKNAETELYLGVKNIAGASTSGDLLRSALNGHFSGSKYTNLPNDEMGKIFEKIAPNSGKAISSLTTVPSLALNEREYFMQGLERFIDASEMSAENQAIEYQAIFIAEPVSAQKLAFTQQRYEEMSSQISPLVKQQLSFNYSDSQSLSTTISKSITESFTQSESSGTNQSDSEGMNENHQTGSGHHVNVNAGISIPMVANIGGGYGESWNESYSVGKSLTKTIGTSQISTAGKSTGSTDTEANGEAKTATYGNAILFDSVNKSIQQISNQLDVHLERVKECRSFGGWQTASYFLASHSYIAMSLASIMQGVLRGEQSYVENSAISTWEPRKSKEVLNWLSNLKHPQFNSPVENGIQLTNISPATLVSGKEMAIQLSLPRRSTSTVTVVEAVPFGRRIQNVNGESSSAERIVNLGQVRHLWQDLPQKVELDVEKLSGHIFVTGSTGSGKSNTVYQLLGQLNQNNVKFLVIEPAKGEYKNVFGHRDDVHVFGTNPKQAELLRINPFKFPATGENAVHILEHVDRLIEIFSVCWTMYDAMPAILKQAMLDAYQASGWNLEKSCNLLSDDLFPNFTDLLAALKKAIDKSDYSAEVKGNYKGALITRVESLTNGLNKQIFTANEIDNAVLFDENVIVDLSRIGSQETKSLIMGVLVMRLNEYRMSNAVGMNSKLKHVTVLEEAHNILKNTQGSQGVGGSNVMGKSVEMLSNAIAEMRTFGEGFIIADQSPSTVDISAIRNTNTKIVMRLPDETDRRLAGKASGVTDAQLEEIAKLPKGVAVVYQNDWLEPILCSVYHFKADEKAYRPNLTEQDGERKIFNTELAKFLLKQTAGVDLTVLKDGAKRFDLPQSYRQGLLNSVAEFEQYGTTCIWNDGTDLVNLLLSVFNSQQEALQHIKQSRELSELATKVEQLLNDHICQETMVMQMVMQIVQNDLAELWKTHHRGGVI